MPELDAGRAGRDATRVTPPHLLLLPGLSCDAALWSAQIEGLADFGRVSVADVASDDTLAAMATRVLAAAPAQFAVAGLSMGGYLAFELLRRAPARITALCLIATSAAPDTALQARRRRILMGMVARQSHFAGLNPNLLPSLLHPDHLADARLANCLTAMAHRVGRAGFLVQQHAILHRPDSRADLPAIAVPTLIVQGESDAITPAGAATEMAAGIPHANLLVLERCGHLPPLERPHAITRAMRAWLAALAPAAASGAASPPGRHSMLHPPRPT